MKKLFLIFLLILILVPVFILGYLGLLPGLSALLGTNKPRDLGIKSTLTDLTSARGKSQIVYEVLPPETPPEKSREFSGSRPVKAEFSSAEVTALLNNRHWKYWPYENVQVKFNSDGSGEISGVLLKDLLPGYGAKIGAPKEAIDLAMKFLPANPVFYVKGKATLSDNKVSLFEPEKFEIGRLSLPVEMFLSLLPPALVKNVYAADTGDLAGELAKVQNKRALIINYINQRIAQLSGFYAKSAYFAENKLVFDGNLSEKEATVR